MSKAIQKERLYVFTLVLVQFCQILDFVIMMPLGPILMREFDISPAQFGLIVSAYNLSAAPFTLLVGMISDRFDRKKILMFAFIGFILATLFCGLAHKFYFLVLARIFAGAFGGVLNASVFAVMSDLVAPERRGKATGTILSSFSFASVMGIPMGLWIANHYSWRHSFFFICAVAILPLLAGLKIIPSLTEHIARAKEMGSVWKNYVKVLTNKNYTAALMLPFVVTFSSFLLIPFISPFVVKNVGMAESDLGLIYLFGGGLTIFTARLIGIMCDRIGSLKMYYIVASASFVPILFLTTAGTMPLFPTLCISTLFMSIVSGRFIPTVSMATQVPTPEHRGTFMSFMNAFRSFASGLSAYVGGLIIVEAADGKLLHYDRVGYFSIALIGLSFFVARKVKRS